MRLRFETFGPKEIEVGGQPVASTEIYVQELARSVFVDAEGTVLRVDLGRHPVSGAPRWIRLLPRLD